MLKPTWETADGTVKLWRGDCRAAFSSISAEALIFDPPYGIEHSTNHGASWSGNTIAGDGDTKVRDEILGWWGGELPWACFGTWKIPSPEHARGALVWDKGPAFGMGDLSFPWKPSWEEIYIGGRGWIGTRDEGVIRGHLVVSWESKGRVHQHQKPVSLVAYLLGKLPNAATVCDPTLGSGTTAIACLRTGRKFLGCEIEPKYFDIAVSRIEAELNRQPLFEPKPAKQLELLAG